jgi:hypothetical protein
MMIPKMKKTTGIFQSVTWTWRMMGKAYWALGVRRRVLWMI